MTPKIVVLSLAALALTGCTAVLNQSLPPGRMNEAGTIRPCHNDGYDAQACGNALFNETVIGKIHTGQSLTDVRAIMRHDAERRTVDPTSESWGYITSYRDKVMTWITFTDQKVSSLKQQPWLRD